MLKITEVNNTGNKIELKLEGKIVGTCIDYLSEVCTDIDKRKVEEVMLDFSGVRYVESGGVDILQKLMKDNIKIKNCPIFIEELLKKSNL
ncbi:MAG: STAS domain-containing protein [Candidatus Dadabacteria bacterium]|nr:STAS domain-containing protein [Candidatus Dadabacteria bacterium]NIV41242.1 STAS domain-containing protein [Candidatus Dadabacteria bacterium]NIX15980.1 STAS domain-containing protein [Candidatus Dadabacteria bacterium]